MFVEPKDTFSEEHSLDEPYVVELSEVTPYIEPDDPVYVESSPLHPFLAEVFHPSIESTFVESETFVPGSIV